MSLKQLPGYYAILPPKIRYNRNLSANAKLLWAELSALQSHNNEVFATNDYLASLLGLKTERQIQYLLKELKEEKLITIEHSRTSRTITVKNGEFGISDKPRVNKKKKSKDPEWLEEYVKNFEKDVVNL